MEDFSDRYENLGLVGCQYASFVPANEPRRTQFIINTRVYSCILINTELLDQRLEERWRGRYNEDTDLALRVLSTGDLCTVNFNNLLTSFKSNWLLIRSRIRLRLIVQNSFISNFLTFTDDGRR